MGGKFIDLTGKRFEKLEVICQTEKPIGADVRCNYWLCKCDCGNEKVLATQDLTRKNHPYKSCGCLTLAHDLTGMKFGRLTVINRVENDTNDNTQWNCLCECGTNVIVRKNNLTKKATLSCGCLNKEQKTNLIGDKHPSWKGGRQKTGGYIEIKIPSHPNANVRGMIREHVYIMSQHLGRPLTDKETVHHKNGIKDDNRLENLELWASSHPGGQRVDDLIHFAVEILKKYKPDLLSEKGKNHEQ